MSQTQEAQKRKKRKKRMRLPNGLGSVHMIGDGKGRRKPWRARVPSHVEFNEATGKATQKYITVGYFETEIDAINALMEYRKNPYTLEAATATFEDVFQMWKAKKYQELSKHGQSGYNSAFKNCEAIHKMKIRDIRTSHLDGIMQTIEAGYQVQARLKTFWGLVFKYAMEHDLIEKNYSDFVKVRDKDPGTKRTAVSPEDREKLWKEIDAGNQDAEIAMIYLYTGMRPSELLLVEKANVNLETRILIGGLKTEAGQNRHIPIHKCIMPFVEKLMEKPGEYLVMNEKGKTPRKMTYNRYREDHWIPLMEKLEMPEYTMHYGRHTCATMMREANIEEDIRKLIIGHKSIDITDRYTHIPDAMLVEAIDKIPGRKKEEGEGPQK